MKFRFLFLLLTLASSALANRRCPLSATTPSASRHVSARSTTSRAWSSPRSRQAQPGDTTGLALGDLLIGYRSLGRPEPRGEPVRHGHARELQPVPPELRPHEHTVPGARAPAVPGPDIDHHACLRGSRQAWPAGALGITVTERPNEPRISPQPQLETKPDLVVVSTYPYMLAYRLGIRAGDVIYGAKITQENGNYLGFSISGADDLDKCLKAARQAPDTETLVITVMRPVPDVAPRTPATSSSRSLSRG